MEDPEDELIDLLTYDCPITGKKRCPPCLQLGSKPVAYMATCEKYDRLSVD
jgi:hypothetical protein